MPPGGRARCGTRPEEHPRGPSEGHCPYIIRTLCFWRRNPIVPTSTTARDDRIELRASREEKRVLAAAAAYQRLDLTSFVMRSALPAAQEIVAQHERMTLTARDSTRVLALLEHPPKPPAALRAAAKRRRSRR